MLCIPYYEKKLYELPEDQVTPQVIMALADSVELEIAGAASPRPILSVPHLLADESACYYQGYTSTFQDDTNDYTVTYWLKWQFTKHDPTFWKSMGV